MLTREEEKIGENFVKEMIEYFIDNGIIKAEHFKEFLEYYKREHGLRGLEQFELILRKYRLNL